LISVTSELVLPIAVTIVTITKHSDRVAVITKTGISGNKQI